MNELFPVCNSSDTVLVDTVLPFPEAAIMHRMHHDDVVRLYGVVLDTKQIMMVSAVEKDNFGLQKFPWYEMFWGEKKTKIPTL